MLILKKISLMVKINFGEVSKTLKNIMSMIVAG